MYGRSRSRDLCVAWLRAGAQKWNSSTFLEGGNPLFRTNGEPEKGEQKDPKFLSSHTKFLWLITEFVCLIPVSSPFFGPTSADFRARFFGF